MYTSGDARNASTTEPNFAPIKLVVEETQWKADTQQKRKLNFSDSVLSVNRYEKSLCMARTAHAPYV